MYRQACARLLTAGAMRACEAAHTIHSQMRVSPATSTSARQSLVQCFAATRGMPAAVQGYAHTSGLAQAIRCYSSAVSLSALSPGHRKTRKRRARGGGDKQAGRGYNGQKSRSGTGKPALFFEGGQTPFWKRLPKRGFHNPFTYVYDNVLVSEIDAYVRMGKLDPRNVITMKHMYDAGLLEKKAYNRDGVALLATQPSAWKRARLERALGYGLPDSLQYPIEIEVATVSEPARACIETLGGKVHRVFYNSLGMRALLVPEWFEKKGRLLPGPASIVPYKKQWRYDDVGTIPATQRPAIEQMQ